MGEVYEAKIFLLCLYQLMVKPHLDEPADAQSAPLGSWYMDQYLLDTGKCGEKEYASDHGFTSTS